jgi:hypothetical protein
VKIIRVESCEGCPLLCWDRANVVSVPFCGKEAQENRFPKMEWNLTMPSWCPLEDEKEAGDERG